MTILELLFAVLTDCHHDEKKKKYEFHAENCEM